MFPPPSWAVGYLSPRAETWCQGLCPGFMELMDSSCCRQVSRHLLPSSWFPTPPTFLPCVLGFSSVALSTWGGKNLGGEGDGRIPTKALTCTKRSSLSPWHLSRRQADPLIDLGRGPTPLQP